MQFLDRLVSSRHVIDLSARVRALSEELGRKPAAALLRRQRKRVAGALLLVLSLAAGFWAHDLARAEILSEWLAGNPPSAAIWRHALEIHGYRQVTTERDYRRAARTLPSLADDPAAVWMTADGTWIAIYRRAQDRIDAVLYCLECAAPPAGWGPAGRGWAAFDPVLARASEAEAARKPVEKPRAPDVDPLELRY